jgi:hypothetical protein
MKILIHSERQYAIVGEAFNTQIFRQTGRQVAKLVAKMVAKMVAKNLAKFGDKSIVTKNLARKAKYSIQNS